MGSRELMTLFNRYRGSAGKSSFGLRGRGRRAGPEVSEIE